MKIFEKGKEGIEARADLGLDLIRIYLGIGLMLKGIFFMANRGEVVTLIDDSAAMWFAPAAIAHYVIIAHLVGGFLLTIGLFTRPAALIQIPILLGAVFFVHMPRMVTLGMREDVEFSALTLFLLMVIFLYGAGRFSLDNYFARKSAVVTPPGPVEKMA